MTMLVLSRKKQESIVIAGGITITILDFDGNRIRLGITAPDEVKIVRSELLTDQEVRDGVEVGRGSPTLALDSGSISAGEEQGIECWHSFQCQC
jgi:carbon storage regulator